MPTQNLEQVKQREQRLAKTVAGLAENSAAAERRALRKKLRRAQRKRRRLSVIAERRAKAGKPKQADGAASAPTPAAATDEAKKE